MQGEIRYRNGELVVIADTAHGWLKSEKRVADAHHACFKSPWNALHVSDVASLLLTVSCLMGVD